MSEVYIDGVNVAECKQFDDGDCLNPALTVLSCEAETNCLYKQLQRMKAENEKLKAYIDSCNDEFGCAEMSIIKAENEKLKKEVKDLNFYIDSYRQVWEVDKYRKALEEIKEIAELEVIIFDNKSLFPTNIQKIIDKIDEVLN